MGNHALGLAECSHTKAMNRSLSSPSRQFHGAELAGDPLLSLKRSNISPGLFAASDCESRKEGRPRAAARAGGTGRQKPACSSDVSD